MAESAPRFPSVSEADLGRLVDDKDAKNTKRATKTALRVLQQYLKEKKVSEPQTKDGISNVLKLFYAEARKVDGTSYSKSTLNSLRFGLGRHFKATLGFDIINDPAFAEANKVFGAKCVELKRQGLAKVEHTPPICEEDLKKLYESDVFKKFQFDSVFPETFSDVLSLNPFCKPFEFRFTRYSRLSLIKMFTLKRVIAWLTLLLFCEMSQRLYIYNCIIKQLLDSVFA